MTLELDSWHSHPGRPLAEQTKTQENAPNQDDIKRMHLIGALFDRVLDLVNGGQPLPRLPYNIDRYDLIHGPVYDPVHDPNMYGMYGVPIPNEHKRGYVREAFFGGPDPDSEEGQGLWARWTTPGLPGTVMNAFVRTDGRDHEYHETDLTHDLEHPAATRSYIGVEQMGAHALILGNLQVMESKLETESIANGHKLWPHQLSEGDLGDARIPRAA